MNEKEKWPRVAIIVLNWNNYDDTKECLNSLNKITYPNYEVIVVDNGSTDGSGEKLKREFSQHVVLQNEKNLGFTGGNNVGMKYSLEHNADYVLLLNDDTVVDRDFLEPLVKVAESHESIGIVGPKVYYMDPPNLINFAGGTVNLWTGKVLHIGDKEIDKGQYDEVKEIDYQVGCAILIKKEVIENIGFLDDIFFILWEETDYCYRAKKYGYKVLHVPESKIWHKIARSIGLGTPFSIYYSFRNQILFMRKNAKLYHWLTFLPYFCYAVGKSITGLIIKRDFAKLKAIISAILWHINFWAKDSDRPAR